MGNPAKNKILHLLVFVLLLIIFFPMSCAYDTEFTYINDQIIALNNRVQKLEESIEQVDQRIDTSINTKVTKQLDTINSNQAGMMVDIDRLKRDISEIGGRVEDNEHIIKRSVEKDLSQQDSIHAEIEKLSDILPRIEKLETMVKQQGEYLGLETAEAMKTEHPATETVPGQPAATTAVTTAVSQGQKSIEEEAYNDALSLYRSEKYEQSIDAFTRFLSEYPKSDLADNAQYWIGECFMALKQYDRAILAYNKAIKDYPKGNKVPNAMLRQALAFLEINDKTSTKIVLKQLIKQFPGSNEAKIAENKLKAID